MSQELKTFIEENIPEIELSMTQLIQEIAAPESLKESMLYSLKAGGKRIRPLFVLAVLQLFDRKVEEGLAVSAVIEMIHTFFI